MNSSDNFWINHLPGPGTVYMEQTLKFTAPVFYNDVIIARVEVANIDKEHQVVLLNTNIRKKNNDQMVIEGKAKVKMG